MACCLVTGGGAMGGGAQSPDQAHCTGLVIHPNDEKLPEHKKRN